MSKSKIIGLYFIAILLILNTSSALNDRIKLQKCDFSVSSLKYNPYYPNQRKDYLDNEATIFKQWDETGNEGLFLSIINNNLELGAPVSYEITYHTPEKPYFNEFVSTENKSRLPIIDLNKNDKALYTKCYFIVGEEKIIIGSSGYTRISYLTSDFNLTKGIIPNPPNIINLPYPHSSFGTRLEYGYPSDWYNNMVNDEQMVFYPRTEPYEVFYTDLKDMPTSLQSIGFFLARDYGDSEMITQPRDLYFYIKGLNQVDYLLPSYEITKIEDLDTGESRTNNFAKFLLEAGHNYRITNTFSNPYKLNIIDLTLTTNARTYYSQVDGCGIYLGVLEHGVDIPYFSTPDTTKSFDIGPYETKSISWDFTIPEDVSICSVLHTIRVYNKMGGNSVKWPRIGSDNAAYLAFSGIRQYLGLIDGKPFFKATTFLNVPAEPYNTPVIYPNTYSIITRIKYKNLTSKITRVWREDETILTLDKIKEITSGLEHIPKGHNKYNFTAMMPIEEDMPVGEYSIDFYSKALTGRFAGKKIAYLPSVAKFERGELQNPPSEASGGRTFRFGIDSKRDTRQITLFNPDWYAHNLTLSITSKSDAQNFSFEFPQKVELKAVESKTIEMAVNATYDPWPSGKDLLENFRLRVSTDQSGVNPSEITYYLNVSKAYWINLIAKTITPKSLFFVENEDIAINATWQLQASEKAFNNSKGKPYSIKIGLINNKGKETAKTASFSVDENWKTKNYTAHFNIAQKGNYSAKLYVDVANNINESMSSGVSGEKDNILLAEEWINVKDADEEDEYCAIRFNKNLSEINCSEGETACWSPYSPYYEKIDRGEGGCCGDDTLGYGDYPECWIDNLNNSCCDSYKYPITFSYYLTDADYSQGFCNLLGGKVNNTISGLCNNAADKKSYCWNAVKQQCCGDDKGETWTYFTNKSLSEIIVNGTCSASKWHAKKKGMYYNLDVNLTVAS